MYHNLKTVAKTQLVNPKAIDSFIMFAVDNWREYNVVTDNGVHQVSTLNSERLVNGFRMFVIEKYKMFEQEAEAYLAGGKFGPEESPSWMAAKMCIMDFLATKADIPLV